MFDTLPLYFGMALILFHSGCFLKASRWTQRKMRWMCFMEITARSICSTISNNLTAGSTSRATAIWYPSFSRWSLLSQAQASLRVELQFSSLFLQKNGQQEAGR
ncbi:hypothetical protein [Pontiella sulfatireligans]|uniref:hypothetical protein n=1 Tax=Pontiella sulfatireligans TaxID=2750658 RepID=UPI00109D46DE|nr:hypothetical protein [Pontiella sulfatireligans]